MTPHEFPGITAKLQRRFCCMLTEQKLLHRKIGRGFLGSENIFSARKRKSAHFQDIGREFPETENIGIEKGAESWVVKGTGREFPGTENYVYLYKRERNHG